jgi:hypothetical protein
VALVDSKIDSFKFFIVKNLKTCRAVNLYIGYIMSKAQRPNVNNGLDTGQNKAVNLVGLIVTSANIVG